MSINYEKYIDSKGTHYISNSGGDERGKITGGKAGDQTGGEWKLKAWYNRPWTHVFRHPDPKVRRLIAELAIEAALNDNIGYDQNQRGTFWQQLKVSLYRPMNIKVACEADCSAGANSIVKAVGYLLNDEKLKNVSSANSSRNTRSGLKAAGFKVLTDKKYLTSAKYLLPGDILLYENHHVATNITRGSKAEGDVADSVDTSSPIVSGLCIGSSGSDVKQLQKNLISLGYSCGADGPDGDFGTNTENALKSFQKDHGLTQNGVYDKDTQDAMQKALSASASDPGVSYPMIVIFDCKQANIRSGPGTEYASIGIVNSGDKFRLVEPGEWKPVVYDGRVGWVSGKYAKQVTE